MKLYLVGSLRNIEVPKVGEALRHAGHEVYDDWFSPGPQADEFWQSYEIDRGHTYREALEGRHADMVFNNDMRWLAWAEGAVLVLPAGRSAHLELGYMVGRGKPTFVYFASEPDRYDIMYRLATHCAFDLEELIYSIDLEDSRG